MCGRFALSAMPEEVREFFSLMELEDFPPRYNIAPTQPIVIVQATEPANEGSNRPDRKALLVRWGLLPRWVKDTKAFPLLINARSETASEKAAFKAAMRHRRVLVPASGFYEWRRGEGRKARSQPFWIRPRGGGVIAFAGLMETYADAAGGEIDTAAILTTAANSALSSIHDRMPVVIEPGDFARWLDCRTQEPRDVAELLRPVSDDFFEAIPVSEAVNAVANDNSALQVKIEPITEPPGSAADEAASEKPGGAQLSLF
ncbi:SOS response-associated peptidase [Rhizobium sp. EC-SD404]|uniref:SOS response-associated peptidase n=1 Tax=Rhizobium sp. EC-SD404 TaxID=2038389 RepID=UPI001260040A|nr:SOS response-associated peptidase [Rhizobium sp. EC-SD404]